MIAERFVARQPILNKYSKTVAYELLFRNSSRNSYPVDIDSHTATQQTIYNSFLEIGLNEISSGKKILINIDEKSLHDDLIFNLPTEKVSLEILENIEPTGTNIERIKMLKRHGFEIALDDFILNSSSQMLLKYCSLIKIDIRATPVDTIKEHVKLYKKMKIKLLAEKVETHEEYEACKKMGFDFYQGYFFNKPEMISTKKIESQKHVVLLAYKSIFTEEPYPSIAEKISTDLGLSEKFLRYSNGIIEKKRKNVKKGRDMKITSVLQALSFIGHDHAKKFFNLAMIDLVESKKPMEIVDLSMIRGQFMSMLFETESKEIRDMAYLAGFFYKLDVLLDKDIRAVLMSLNLHEDIENAILKNEGQIGLALKLSEAIEQNDYDSIDKYAKELKTTIRTINTKYQRAIKWRNNVMSGL